MLMMLLSWAPASSGRDVAIDGILRPLVSGIAADSNWGKWKWDANFNGGYLLRLDMDVTGDGRTEIFIASTLESTKHEHYWTAFDVTVEGAARPYGRRLEFTFAWPMKENSLSGLMSIGPPDRDKQRDNEERAYPAFMYYFKFPDIQEDYRYLNEKEVVEARAEGKDVRPELRVILLYEYLTSQEVSWTPVKRLSKDAADCYFLPEDKERAMRNTAFTPQVALTMLDGTKPAPISAPMPASPEAAATPPHSPVPAAEPQILKKGEEPTLVSSTRWSALLAVVILTGAALVLVRRVIKRRQ